MALVLSLAEGDTVYVNDSLFTMETIFGDGRCDLVGGSTLHEIKDDMSTEIYPDVMVSAGFLGANSKQIRLIFSAPRKIGIWRGKEYWERKNGGQ